MCCRGGAATQVCAGAGGEIILTVCDEALFACLPLRCGSLGWTGASGCPPHPTPVQSGRPCRFVFSHGTGSALSVVLPLVTTTASAVKDFTHEMLTGLYQRRID